MLKSDVVERFKEEVLPLVKKEFESDGVMDRPARSEAWNDFTDALCKDGEITSEQYSGWVSPAICG